EAGNPLLSGLGEQGQQFVRLLSGAANLETPLFLEPTDETLLAALQRDILLLQDGRDAAEPHSADASIEIVSAHSALREVQALHDWLLHRFNDDPTLTPRDVVVMCPNVEQYAPFIEATFAGRGEALREDAPPLPCSIADRHLGSADPAVAAFLELLRLPDARFQASQVIGWLRVPAIQARFQLTSAQLATITEWLEEACIHWGLDTEHKGQWLSGPVSDRYTWQQGLERLLLGFAWGDEEAIVRDRLLLPRIEGEEAVVLGRLSAFLRTLKGLSRAMRQPRTVAEWQQFLHDRLRAALFASGGEHEAVQEDLGEVIRELGQYAGEADFTEPVPLAVIRHALEHSLQAPGRTGRHFLTGQITVCSMVPMRSIPFRILAILGLNDDDFPRQRPPLGFDLMADAPPRPGDRSRRGDDRYLFLEALLSARERLYLSYQGRDVKTNSERQPSLVLSELLNYLEQSSTWQRSAIRQLPLQPFSRANYHGDERSFDRGWLRLSEPGAAPTRCCELPTPEEWPSTLPLDELLRVLAHPARAFAEQRLTLYLGDGQDSLPASLRSVSELADSEPFATDHLLRYQLQQALTAGYLNETDTTPLLQRARLSGELPEHALIETELADWAAQAEGFAAALREHGADQISTQPVDVTIEAFTPAVTLVGAVPLRAPGELLLWRLANPKGKDYLRLWLTHLLANTQQPTVSTGLYRGTGSELAEIKLTALTPQTAKEELTQLLETWREALCTPLPLHADLLGTLIGKGGGKPAEQQRRELHKAWQGDDYRAGCKDDPYLAWFWTDEIDCSGLLEALKARYGALLSHML
ncbi:exodeoxyribonuclease V subunit gamma, partial [Halorhodospira abdelmalekii]|uniref:exodeoxyribonuclease V subunit gamma n=1 Tax=Halorhodospira abdelmalekii TaxID=421629 RepID=UPI001904B0AE